MWLIALPVLVDLLLWLGPRLSASPLAEVAISLLKVPTALGLMTHNQLFEMTDFLASLGERITLFSFLGLVPMLNVPSLLAGRSNGPPMGMVSPLGRPQEIPVSGAGVLLGWWAVLIPLGLLLGFVYLNGLARWVLKGRPAKQSRKRRPLAVGVSSSSSGEELGALQVRNWRWKLTRILVFELGLCALAMFFVPPWMWLWSATARSSGPVAAELLVHFSWGLVLYVAMHLLFVIPGVLVGGRGLWRAVWESIAILHTQSLSVLGLVLLVMLIQGGLSRVWLLPGLDSWALLVGILGNGCIVTGLMAAVFVFYRERIGELMKLFQGAAGA